MTYPLVRELAAEGVPVAVTCRVLKFSKQGYFKWLQAPCSRRDYENAYLTNAILDVHRDDPAFGYRFIADELERKGLSASENRVHRLAREQRVWSVIVKKKHRYKVPGLAVCDDLVQRDFSAEGPNRLWLTDITEHPTGEGTFYFCSVKDVFSNRIVGYSSGSRMPAALAVNALRHAVERRGPGATIVHSDRGSQGEFKWSSQHFDHGGSDGATCGLDEGADGTRNDEITWTSVVSPRGRADVLVGDRQGRDQRRSRGEGGSFTGGRRAMVPPSWGDGID